MNKKCKYTKRGRSRRVIERNLLHTRHEIKVQIREEGEKKANDRFLLTSDYSGKCTSRFHQVIK